MSGMTHGQILDQRQLLRLRKLREEVARSAREQQCKARESATQAVEAREREQARLRAEHRRLACWAQEADPAAIPQWAPLAQARAARLNERMEEGKEHLRTETEQLDKAQAALDEAHACWIAACSRTRSVDEWLTRSLRRMGREMEQRAEREQDATGPSGRPGETPRMGDAP